mgnify:CR=1 FL=1
MFPGFRAQVRSIREYPFNAGGNLLGYVSEVNSNYLEKHPGLVHIALAFEFQIFDEVPFESHDILPEMIILGVKKEFAI